MSLRNLIPWSRSGSGRELASREQSSDPVLALRSDIDRVFENFWHLMNLPMQASWEGASANARSFSVDVHESDNQLEVVAELPGMEEGDVDVSLADGMLTIRGERTAEQKKEEKGYVLRERRVGRVERVVPLPPDLDLDAAKAMFKNGVLTVTIPRMANASAGAKRIQVQRG